MQSKTLFKIYRAIRNGRGCVTATMLAVDLKLAQKTVGRVVDAGLLACELEYGTPGPDPSYENPLALTPAGSALLDAEEARVKRAAAREAAVVARRQKAALDLSYSLSAGTPKRG